MVSSTALAFSHLLVFNMVVLLVFFLVVIHVFILAVLLVFLLVLLLFFILVYLLGFILVLLLVLLLTQLLYPGIEHTRGKFERDGGRTRLAGGGLRDHGRSGFSRVF